MSGRAVCIPILACVVAFIAGAKRARADVTVDDLRTVATVGAAYSPSARADLSSVGARLGLDVHLTRAVALEALAAFDYVSPWSNDSWMSSGLVGVGGGVSLRPRPRGALVVFDAVLGPAFQSTTPDQTSWGGAWEMRAMFFPLYASLDDFHHPGPCDEGFVQSVFGAMRPNVWVSERRDAAPLRSTFAMGLGVDIFAAVLSTHGRCQPP